MWGRLVVIAYALIAIPLFMLALANIGEILANLFRVTYSTICCCGCCRVKPKPQVMTAILAPEGVVSLPHFIF